MTYHWLIHAFSFLWMGDVQQNQAKIVLHSKIEKITSRHATYVGLFSTVSDSVINAGITDLKNKISPLPSKNIPTYPYILRGEKKGEGVKQKREGVRKREI